MVNVVIFDSASGEWRHFSEPKEIVVAHDIREIVPSLTRVEHRVNKEQLYAAGFVSYEASPAFDRALRVRRYDHSFPLMWFGLFEEPAVIRLQEPGPCPQLEWKPTISRQSYDDAIARIKNYIATGDTYQVNFSFRMTASCDTSPYELFLQLTHTQRSRNAAFIETDDFAICSASPELFFSLDGKNILARPMKGTAPRGLTLKNDVGQAEFLRTSEKNRAENVMIVDMMRNDIGRIAQTGSVHVPSLFDVERYATVLQMTSTVAATSG
ncbi:MAG: chorismate-binding protein, partial [Bacteroidetes bacterium]|nr:chorismate-binding protein [Bacteroidota bacterium]